MRVKALLSICFSFYPLVAQAAPIHDAAKTGDAAAIAAALDAGADVNDPEGSATPLYHAVRRQHADAARLLIERGADVNAVAKTGGTPLLAAAEKGNVELIVLLLANGANPNAMTGDKSALHVVAKLGCLDCVRALVEAGAGVNIRMSDPIGRTPVHLARRYDREEVSEYLMANGVVLPVPASIAAKLANADAERGRAYFESNCDGCHNAEPGRGTKEGPNLWDIVGRDKASVPDASYSKTLLALEGAWTYEDLNSYLYGPTLTTPGVAMEIPGVSDETERADLIAYLRTLSDSPVPLP